MPTSLLHPNKLLYLAIALFNYFSVQAQIRPQKDTATGLWGYVSEKEEWEIAPQFSKAYPFQEKVARVAVGKSYYLINPKGKFVTKETFDYIGWADDNGSDAHAVFQLKTIGYKKERLWGLLSEKGKPLFPPTYGAIFAPSDGVFKVAEYDASSDLLKFGLISSEGVEIAPPIYEELQTNFSKGLIKVGNYHPKMGWLWGLINVQGKELLPPKYPKIERISDQLLAIQDPTNSFFKLIDHQGKPLSNDLFQFIAPEAKGYCIAVREGRYGLLNAATGKEALPFQYQLIRKAENGWSIVPYPNYQLTDLKGNPLDTLYYDRLENIGKGVYRFWLNGVAGLLTSEGKTLSYDQFETVAPFDKEGFSIVEREGKKGLFHLSGSLILPISFTAIERAAPQHWWAADESGKQFLFDDQGASVLPDDTLLTGSFSGGRYRIARNGKVGFLDKDLKESIAPQFLQAENIQKHQACVQLPNGYFGAVDDHGKWIIRPLVDSLASFQPTLFFFKNNGFAGVINGQGIELSRLKADQYQLTDSLIYVQEAGKWGLINAKGKQVLPTIYDTISEKLPDQLVELERNGQLLYMDTEHHLLPNDSLYRTYDAVGFPSEKRIAVKQSGKWGFADHVGRLLISNQFDSVQAFSNGRAAVLLGGKWGFVDPQGKLIIQPRSESVGAFKTSGVIVKQQGKKGVLNFEGEVILPAEFEEIETTQHGNWLVKQNGKWGIYASDGLKGIYAKYDFVADLGNGFVITRKEGKYGFDQLNGFSVVFPTYDLVQFNRFDSTFFLITEPKPTIWNPE